MAELNHNVIAGWLLSILTFVLASSILFVYLVIRLRHHNSQTIGNQFHRSVRLTHTVPSDEKHLNFKQPACWLAIKCTSVRAVQSALALDNVKPCSWSDGLSGNAAEKLFISPPVFGWILVIGSALPDPCGDEDASFCFLSELSRQLGHVQFFSANCVLNQHAWARLENGHVQRAYAWAGRTLWNQGDITDVEEDLGMLCYDYAQSVEHSAFATGDIGLTNSDKVHLLAAHWSMDPEQIDERFTGRAWGIVGDPARYS